MGLDAGGGWSTACRYDDSGFVGGGWSGRLKAVHYGFDESFDFGGTTVRNDEVGVTVIRGGISYHFN